MRPRRRLLHPHRALPWLGLAALAILASPAGAAGQGEAVVTAAVQVTANPSPVRAYSSPLVARSPKTAELVVASVDTRGDRRCRVWISPDDGRSWFEGGDPMVEPFTDCSIGAEWGSYFGLFFDRDGALHLAFAANDPAAFAGDRPVTTDEPRDHIPRHVFLARSSDGGRTFATTTVYRTANGHPDRYNKGVVGAVDPEDPTRVYVGWRMGSWASETQKLKVVVAASRDGGRTFSSPVDISDEHGGDHPWLTVGPGGAVHAVYWARSFGYEDDVPPRPVYHVVSRDHGRTWTRTAIDPGNDRSYRTPVIAADPESDAVYVVWAGSPTLHNDDLPEGTNDRLDIFFRASLDGGRRWGDRVVVNDDDDRPVNHELPGMAIAPGGRVDVAWYDFRHSPSEPGDPEGESGLSDIYHVSSTDRGRTFGPNIRISDRSADRSIGIWSGSIGSAGPVGVASTETTAYFAWQDTRNGNERTDAEDVYMATIDRTGVGRPEPAGGSRVVWSLLGAAATLVVGGAVLVAASRVTRREAGRKPERVGAAEREPS